LSETVASPANRTTPSRVCYSSKDGLWARMTRITIRWTGHGRVAYALVWRSSASRVPQTTQTLRLPRNSKQKFVRRSAEESARPRIHPNGPAVRQTWQKREAQRICLTSPGILGNPAIGAVSNRLPAGRREAQRGRGDDG